MAFKRSLAVDKGKSLRKTAKWICKILPSFLTQKFQPISNFLRNLKIGDHSKNGSPNLLKLNIYAQNNLFMHGGVAHLGERLNGIQEVRGSIPLVSTTVKASEINGFAGFYFLRMNGNQISFLDFCDVFVFYIIQ